MTLLELAGVKKHFGATHALDGVDLEIRSGEVYALIGENGAGKSTLMNVISGAIEPDVGTMRFAGREYRPTGPQDARQQGIAYIHQELSLCPHLSVAENIMLGLEPRRRGWLDRRALRSRAAEILGTFDHPAVTPERRVVELPVAARQMVEISRALAQSASLILMDEPTSSLPRADVERLFACIRKLRDAGTSVIYISHFLEEVREVADRFTVLRDGVSVLNGSLGNVTDSQIISSMVGRPVENLFPPRQPSDRSERLLEVRNLCAPPVVHDASFELCRGEVLGIAGLIGSGRTEMIRALVGLMPAEAGHVVIGGRAMPGGASGAKSRALRARGIGYLSEDRKGEGLALELSIADNVTLSNTAACSRWGWLDLKAQGDQAAASIQKLKVKARDTASRVGRLSGGNQQKVAVARLLHQGAEIVLMDEPTRGIDVGSKVQIYEAIAEMVASGKGVLIVSSYLPELFGICDRLAVMVRGRLSPARPISEWTPETVMQAAMGFDAGAELSSGPPS